MELEPLVSRLSILTKRLEVQRFHLNWAQREYLEVAQRQLETTGKVRIIVLKARQLGISTVTEALLFTMCFVYPNYKSLVIAHEIPASQNLLAMTQRYWDTYPFKSMFSTRYAGKNQLQWNETGSSISVATAGNKGVGRSSTIHGVHASEVAFWPDPEVAMLGLRQTIPSTPGTVIVLESTANGMGNYFHKTWVEAEAGESEFYPLFFPWHRHPEYTGTAIGIPVGSLGELDEDEQNLREMGISDDRLVWRRWALRDLCGGDRLKFQQEYPSCVLAGTRVATNSGLLRVESQEIVGQQTPYGEVVASHPQRPVRAVRLTTKSGLQLDCTWHHPMVVGGSEVLVPAAATLGMDLVLADMTHATEPAVVAWSDGLVASAVEMTDDLALFAGYFMGDGYFRDGAMSVVCDAKDEDVADEVAACMSSLGLTPRFRTVGSKGGGCEVRANAVRLIDPFLRMGFARRVPDIGVKRHVQVPECIWRSTREHVRLFLSGLFEADGFSNRDAWDVRLFTCHERFARDVQLLLLTFGIHANVSQESKRGWVVTMRGLEAVAFHRDVGFRSARKSSAVPTTKAQAMRGRRLEVVSVEELGEQPSYDLTIKDRPFYGANGLLTHNTPGEAFVASGTNVFPFAELTAAYEPETGYKGLLVESGSGVEFRPSSDGPLTVYRAPSPDDHGQYFVAGDPTHSTRGDYAVAQVINRRTLEQVAEWRGRIDPVSFADVLFLLGKYYNTAEVTTEIEGPGYATIGALLAKSYPRIYNKARPDATPGKMSQDFYGWSTTAQSKHLAINWLLRVVVDGSLTIHSSVLFNEMKQYVTLDNGGYGPASEAGGSNRGPKGYDDTVMAMAMAIACHFMSSPVMPYGASDPPPIQAPPWEHWET